MQSDPKFARLVEKARTVGIQVWRGERVDHTPADPGDFGAGKYHSTSKARAQCYGPVKKINLKFNKPLVLSVTQAYDLAEQYGTIHSRDRKAASLKMTADLKAAGYDGLIAVTRMLRERSRIELEIVNMQDVT